MRHVNLSIIQRYLSSEEGKCDTAWRRGGAGGLVGGADTESGLWRMDGKVTGRDERRTVGRLGQLERRLRVGGHGEKAVWKKAGKVSAETLSWSHTITQGSLSSTSVSVCRLQGFLPWSHVNQTRQYAWVVYERERKRREVVSKSRTILLWRCTQTFFVLKGQQVNTLGFVGLTLLQLFKSGVLVQQQP